MGPGLLTLKLKHLMRVSVYIIIHVNKIEHFLFSQRKKAVFLNRMGVSKAIFKGKKLHNLKGIVCLTGENKVGQGWFILL